MLAYLLRFDQGIPERYSELLGDTIAFVVVGKVAIFAAFGLYQKWWRYVGLRDFETILKAVVVASLVMVGVLFVWSPTDSDLPRSIAVMDLLLTAALIGGVRLAVRSVLERPPRGAVLPKGQEVLIVGAGEAGQLVAREMQRSPELRQTPIGFVDDDPRKRGMRIHGLKVLGTTDRAGPAARRRRARRGDHRDPVRARRACASKVVRACRERDIPVRTLPGVFELISGSVNLMRQVREVQVEDVLGREPVHGRDRAGRRLPARPHRARHRRRRLDRLGAVPPDRARAAAAAGDARPRRGQPLRDRARADRASATSPAASRSWPTARSPSGCSEVMQRFRPDVVFHAAAYKHVSLTEDNPLEAVRNNAIGTKVCADRRGRGRRAPASCWCRPTRRSTRRPRSARRRRWRSGSWRRSGQRYPDTVFCCVRFGNVLGSSGSVVPLFRRQIEQGGPVTVTHPDMERYFMTIPEAVQLIIRAGNLGRGRRGVRARDGRAGEDHRPRAQHDPALRAGAGRDIPIEIVGPRPGEKLREELFNEGERPVPTEADRILRAERPPLDPEWVEGVFERVERLVEQGDETFLAQHAGGAGQRRSTPAPPMT